MTTQEADEDLMVRYQQGEVRAFEILLGRHRKAVFNFILRYVGDKETAEDLLQTALAGVFTHWDRIRDHRAADAYVRRAMTNQHVSWHRQPWRSAEQATSDVPEPCPRWAGPAVRIP